MGVIVRFPPTRRLRTVPYFWRAGDMALAGSNHVRIAALDGGAVLVVGEAPSGSWSIWMKAANLQPAELRVPARPPAIRQAARPIGSLGDGHRRL